MAALVAATLCVPGLPAADGLVQESVLIAAESLITARRRPRTGLDALLELLITDPDNPRSIGYQADRLRQDVAHVPGPDGGVLEGARFAPGAPPRRWAPSPSGVAREPHLPDHPPHHLRLRRRRRRELRPRPPPAPRPAGPDLP